MAGSVNSEIKCKHVLLLFSRCSKSLRTLQLPDYKNTNYLLSVQYFWLLLCGVL